MTGVGECAQTMRMATNTNTTTAEEMMRQARVVALGMLNAPRRNNAKEMRRYITDQATLDSLCESVWSIVDEDTFEHFMDMIWAARRVGK